MQKRKIKNNLYLIIALVLLIVLGTFLVFNGDLTGNVIYNNGLVNYALPENGGNASASGSANSNFLPSGAINGDRSGLSWGSGGGWNSAALTDWFMVTLNETRVVKEIDLFTIQDSWSSPSEPTLDMTFTSFGIVDFKLQYWTGFSWADVPNGTITNNNKVWRKITISSGISTDKIRLNATRVNSYNIRVAELEVWGEPPGYVPPTCTSFTYSAWSSCSNSQQTRTVTSSLPSGCTGGSPTLTQSCVSPQIICNDTDGGLNYYVKGLTKGFSYVNPQVYTEREDYCVEYYLGGNLINTGQVVENICENNLVKDGLPYTCPYGCSNGACIPCVPNNAAACGTKVCGILTNNCNQQVSCGSCTSNQICNSAGQCVTSAIITSPTTCTENWTCSNWSTCSNNLMTRTCRDVNHCSTSIDKPYLNRSCISSSVPCTENWNCSSWSSCITNRQTRSCNDLNNCGTIANKPSLTLSCQIIQNNNCLPEQFCTLSPLVCPSSGKRTESCVDINACISGATEREIACTPGDCNGCVDLDGSCIEFGLVITRQEGEFFCDSNGEIRAVVSDPLLNDGLTPPQTEEESLFKKIIRFIIDLFCKLKNGRSLEGYQQCVSNYIG